MNQAQVQPRHRLRNPFRRRSPLDMHPVAKVGAFALARLHEMKSKHALVGDVRGLGFLLGIELVTSRVSKAPAKAAAEAVMYRALEKGLSFKTTFGNVLTLTPPLTTTEAEMSRALDIIDESIHETAGAH